MKTHIHGFGPFQFGLAISETTGGGVVGGYFGGARLGMAHLLEDLTDEYGFLAVVEQGSHFGFGGRCHDVVEDPCFDMDGSIGLGDAIGFLALAKVEEPAHSGLGVGFTEVRCVTVNEKDHVTAVEANSGIRVRRGVIEQVDQRIHGVFSSLCLGGRDGAEGHKHGAVDGACIEQQGSNDLLESRDALFGKGWGHVCWGGVLNAGPVDWGCPWVG